MRYQGNPVKFLKSLVSGCEVVKEDGVYFIKPEYITSNTDDYYRKALSASYKPVRDHFSETDEYGIGDNFVLSVNTTDVSDEPSQGYDNMTKDGKYAGELFGIGITKY